MKVANIVYEKDLINHTKVEYVNYVNNPVSYENLDKTLPTLYVGWVFMKSCNPNDNIIQNANILHKKIIGNELYWEFSFDESKQSHVKGVESFIKLAPQFYFNPKYLYVNLDPVFFQLANIDDLMDVIPKKFDSIYILKKEMVYVMAENKIWGINLDMYRFFKFNIDDLISRLSEKALMIHSDLDGSIYQSYYKIFPNFIQLKRHIIAMLSK